MTAFVVVRAARFDRDIARLRKRFPQIERDIAPLLDALASAPLSSGRVIPDLEGRLILKARCGIKSARISKSDGLRVIYFVAETAGGVGLLRIHSKNECEMLSRDEILDADDTAREFVLAEIQRRRGEGSTE